MPVSLITPDDVKKNANNAALSYLWIFSLGMLYGRRDSAFVQFHARQGTVLFVLSLLLWPLALTRYAEVVVLALMAFGFIQAASGKAYRLPVIAELAEGIKPNLNLKEWFKTPPAREPFLGITARTDDELSALAHKVEADEAELKKLESDVKREFATLEGHVSALERTMDERFDAQKKA